jgi:hypothetical protein
MTQLTGTQAQQVVDLALRSGNAARSNMLGYFSGGFNAALLDNVLQPLYQFFNTAQALAQAYAVVQAVAIIRSWGPGTSDAVKLQNVAAAVGSLVAFNANTAATASVSPDSRVPTSGQHVGMGGQLVAGLAALT